MRYLVFQFRTSQLCLVLQCWTSKLYPVFHDQTLQIPIYIFFASSVLWGFLSKGIYVLKKFIKSVNTKGVQVDAFIKSLKGSKGVFFILGLWHRFITKPIIYPYIKANSPHFRVHGIVGSKSFHPSRFIIRPQSYVSPIPKLTKWNNTEINSPVLPKSTGYKTHKTKTLNFPKQKQNPNFVTNNSHQLISQC